MNRRYFFLHSLVVYNSTHPRALRTVDITALPFYFLTFDVADPAAGRPNNIFFGPAYAATGLAVQVGGAGKSAAGLAG